MASSAATETPSTASSIARPPAIDTAIQPVNEEPAELDSTPVSPAEARKLNKKGFSPDFDDEAIDELAGVKGEGVKEREVCGQQLSYSHCPFPFYRGYKPS